MSSSFSSRPVSLYRPLRSRPSRLAGFLLSGALLLAAFLVTGLGVSFAQTSPIDTHWGKNVQFKVAGALTSPDTMSADDDGMTGMKSDSPHSWKPWDGFQTGLRDGFENKPRPLDSPLYFEDPFINTDLRPLILYHEFPKDSLLGGGDLTVMAVQARLALTENLQFFASADGHSDLEADALPAGEGWNDLAAGLKYAFYVDKETHTVVSAGARWKLSNGSRDVFQGIEDELSFFVSGARTVGKFNFIGGVTGRVTTHHNQGNDSLSWDLHANYELCEGFYPVLEYHGFHYLSNGNRLQVRDGLLDYGNLGAGDVAGSSAHWGTIGFRSHFKDGVSFGVGYSHGLNRSANNDIFHRRVITSLIFTF